MRWRRTVRELVGLAGLPAAAVLRKVAGLVAGVEEALARETIKNEASGNPPPHHSIAMFFHFLHIFPISITRMSGDQPPSNFSPITHHHSHYP